LQPQKVSPIEIRPILMGCLSLGFIFGSAGLALKLVPYLVVHDVLPIESGPLIGAGIGMVVPVSPFFAGAVSAVSSHRPWMLNLVIVTLISQVSVGLFLASLGPWNQRTAPTLLILAGVSAAAGGILARAVRRITRVTSRAHRLQKSE